MNLRYFTAILAAFGLAASGAGAQTVAPTAHQLELSQALIDASGAKTNYDKMIDGMMRQIFAQAAQGQTTKSQQNLASLEQAEEKIMAKIKPQIFEVVRNAYATTYTEGEMEAILAFDKTPAGQAMIAKAPALTQNMMGGVIALMPTVKSEMVDAVCDSLHCTAAQRQAMITKMNTPPQTPPAKG
jgi:hypothetical protein